MKVFKKVIAIMLTLILVVGCGLTVMAEEADAPGFEREDANESVMVCYSGHVQTYGWSGEKFNGERVGTVGASKRLEAIKIQVKNIRNLSGGIEYRSHVQTYGWEKDWKSNGQLSGTSGQGKRLEAIQIQLTGQLKEKYDVCYRVHVETFGWLDWAKNGAISGTSGYSKRIEAIEIILVDKGTKVPGEGAYSYINSQRGIRYSAHVQTFGWKKDVENGGIAGTTGLSKRMESLIINLVNCPYKGTVEYRSHVQTYGWEKDWKKNGQKSGTEGQSKRLEALQIRLTGELAEKCDIYYRVHCQRFGWLGWVKNGEMAGTAGYGYRMECLQIMILPKNARTFPNAAGFVDKNGAKSYSWNIDSFATKNSTMVNEQLQLSSRIGGTYYGDVNCTYSWLNNTTGESGVIGTAIQDQPLQWTPTVAGNYTLTMSAKDGIGQEKTKQISVQVSRGGISKSDVLFTAHRGYSSAAPDNSIPAFELAAQYGFDSIETDIVETKDGVFVISHDNNLSNICGVNENISDLTYEQLQNYQKYHIVTGNGVSKYSAEELRIPTLEEYLNICVQSGIQPQLDTKELRSFDSISKLYDILVSYGVQDIAIVTSFNNLYLQLLRELNQNIVLTYGVDSTDYVDVDWCATYNVGVSVNYKLLLPNDLKKFTERGIDMNAYTVTDQTTAGVLIDKGVTGITTDRVLWN